MAAYVKGSLSASFTAHNKVVTTSTHDKVVTTKTMNKRLEIRDKYV